MVPPGDGGREAVCKKIEVLRGNGCCCHALWNELVKRLLVILDNPPKKWTEKKPPVVEELRLEVIVMPRGYTKVGSLSSHFLLDTFR